MSLNAAFLALQIATADAQAAERYKDAPLENMAAQCKPTGALATQPEEVQFSVLEGHREAFNETVADLFSEKISDRELRRAVAAALIREVDVNAKESDVATQKGTLNTLFTDTNAQVPAEVTAARSRVKTTRGTIARQDAWVDLVVREDEPRPFVGEDMLANVGLSYDQVEQALRWELLKQYAVVFRTETGWDCTDALGSTLSTGKFPDMHATISAYVEKPLTVTVHLPNYDAFKPTASANDDVARGDFVLEWTAGDEENEALGDRLEGVDRFRTRYGTDRPMGVTLPLQFEEKPNTGTAPVAVPATKRGNSQPRL